MIDEDYLRALPRVESTTELRMRQESLLRRVVRSTGALLSDTVRANDLIMEWRTVRRSGRIADWDIAGLAATCRVRLERGSFPLPADLVHPMEAIRGGRRRNFPRLQKAFRRMHRDVPPLQPYDVHALLAHVIEALLDKFVRKLARASLHPADVAALGQRYLEKHGIGRHAAYVDLRRVRATATGELVGVNLALVAAAAVALHVRLKSSGLSTREQREATTNIRHWLDMSLTRLYQIRDVMEVLWRAMQA